MALLKKLLLCLLILPFFLSLSSKVQANALTWQKTYSIAENGSIGTSIAVSSKQPNIVFASIRRQSGFDLLKSIDSGQNWVSVKNNLIVGEDPNWISIFKQDSDVVAISLWEGGIYLSENGGNEWTNIMGNPSPRSVAISASNSNTIFAGIGGGSGSSGVYKTIDKGLNWTSMPIGNANNSEMAIDESNDNKVFADIDPNYYRTLDGGLSWTLMLTSKNPDTPLINAFGDTQIDKNDPSTIYVGTYQSVYKSTNSGENWSILSNSINKGAYRLAQDNTHIFMSHVNNGGGVWRSTDGGDTWENVADPAWGTTNTWGLDAGGGRVYVSVEGLGIFVANTDGSPIPTPTPIPGPNPVVLIPGFGASYSYDCLILKNCTDSYSQWQLFPKFTDNYYQPLLSTLKNTGLTDSGPNQNLFTFAYDYRRPISETASWLNDFLNNEVIFKNPGKKANIAAHSMGSLVVRYCFEKIDGCKDKIAKIITAGGPHRGSASAYDLWEAGKINEKDLLLRFGERFLLHLMGLPKIKSSEIIQTQMPGTRDLLPVYDYILGKKYTDLNFQPKNPNLETLWPPSGSFLTHLTTFSGNTTPTLFSFSVVDPSKLDHLQGNWADGKPNAKYNAAGDNTVTQSSSELIGSGATNKYYSVKHGDYFNSLAPQTDLLQIFGLSGTVVTKSEPNSVLAITTSSNIQLSLFDQNGNSISTTDNQKSIFATDLPNQTYQLKVFGLDSEDFQIKELFVNLSSDSDHEFEGTIKKGETQTFSLTL